MSPLERKALAMWQAREMRFPRFVRRMKPDAVDMLQAWPLMLRAAAGDISPASIGAAPAGEPKSDLKGVRVEIARAG